MKQAEQIKAKELRTKGYSVKEIAKLLSVSQSSISVWVRDIELAPKAKKRLLTRIKIGQYNAGETKKRKTEASERRHQENANNFIKRINFSSDQARVICALIYWCEGAKDPRSGINFINSDPNLSRYFLDTLKKAFQIDEGRLHIKMHLHHYHDEETQKAFWAEKLNISYDQFGKTYQKPRGGKRYRENYPGCLSIKYHSAEIARELNALAKAYLLAKIEP